MSMHCFAIKIYFIILKFKKIRSLKQNLNYLLLRDFSGGTVVKNPPANVGDTGSSPGPGRSHMPLSH